MSPPVPTQTPALTGRSWRLAGVGMPPPGWHELRREPRSDRPAACRARPGDAVVPVAPDRRAHAIVGRRAHAVDERARAPEAGAETEVGQIGWIADYVPAGIAVGHPSLLSHPAGAPCRREGRRSVAAPSSSRASRALWIGARQG